MALSSIIQQSLIGDILRFPFAVIRFIFSIIEFVVRSIIRILLFPLSLLWSLLMLPSKLFHYLNPVFYIENITHSFRFFWSGFRTLFLIVTSLLVMTLVPIYLIALLVSKKALTSLYPFDLLKSLALMGGSFVLTEFVMFLLAVVGFLLTLVLVCTLITLYSPLQEISAYLNAVTSSRIVLVIMFLITVCIFVMLYLLMHRGFLA